MTTWGEYITLPGLLAGANLSAKQYYCVKLASTAGEVVAVSASSDVAIGILQNEPADGEPAEVAVLGMCKAMVTPTDVAIGDILGPNSTGLLSDTSTDNGRVVGMAIDASTAAGDIIRVFLFGASRY